MTTPIVNVLDIAQQPPFVVSWQDSDRFVRTITALYEQQTKADREAMLIDDCMSLILRHRMAKGIGMFERNEKIQGCIEDIARLLLSVADGLNTRLPDSFIEQCRNSTEESASRFYLVIAETYITPKWKEPQKNAHNGTDGTGMGSNATAGSETPPAGKKMAEEWLSGKAKEVLDECVNCGLAEKKDDGYYWIEGNQVTGWQIGLYGYFVLMVCEQLNWKRGKAERLDWQKFESVFRNHDEIVGTAKQTVHNFKKGNGVPTLYEKVDKLIEKVFGVNLTLPPKPLD